MFKNSKQKYFVYIFMLYVSTKSFQEKLIFCMVYIKMSNMVLK
jgi:hypothetical protein